MRVLIAEDERTMAEQLCRGLEREGYSVLLAADGQQALDLARNVEHDLMILDWMLPKIEGVEVARPESEQLDALLGAAEEDFDS